MDKRTRVFNAMDKKPVDHVPVGFWHHFVGARAEGEACIQAHLDYIRECDTDLLKIMSDGPFIYPVPAEIKSAGDWRKLEPIGKDHPFILGQVERARRLAKELGKEMPVYYTVFAPFSVLRSAAGDERIMADLREDRQAVMHALDVIAQDIALMTEGLIDDAGCDGIYYSVQGGEYGRVTPEEYRMTIRPSDLYVLERANRYSDYNILHCCGWAGAKNQLELWQDYPAKCVNWAVYVEGLSLADGRYFFGDRCCLGGFESLHHEGQTHDGLLHHGTEEEIRAFTRETILTYGKRGLILGADCTVNEHIPHERIRWVVEEARSI